MDGAPTEVGAVIAGRFVLVRQLGRGGAATVVLAKDRSQEDRLVALKLFHPALCERAEDRGRFLREIGVLEELDHPSIAAAKDFILDGGVPILVLDYVEGVSLDVEMGDRAAMQRPYTAEELLARFGPLCSAVEHAHARGIIHRDLKPQNVMIAPGAIIKVLDFGLAKLVQAEALKETTLGRVLGSVPYMSPEQDRGARVDTATDVFALGCILFELLTLRRTWFQDVSGEPLRAYTEPVVMTTRNTPDAVSDRKARGPRPQPSTYRPDLPEAIDALLARALAVEPKDRPSAGELGHEVLRLLAGLSLDAGARAPSEIEMTGPRTELRPETEPVPEPKPMPVAKPRPRVGALIAVIAVLGLFFGAIRLGEHSLRFEEARPSPREPPSPPPLVAIPGKPAPAPEPAEGTSPARPPATPPQPPSPPPPSSRAKRPDAPRSVRSPPPSPGAHAPAALDLRDETLAALIERARTTPSDMATLERIAREIRAAARTLPEADRARIEALVASSLMVGDVESLARAAKEVMSR